MSEELLIGENMARGKKIDTCWHIMNFPYKGEFFRGKGALQRNKKSPIFKNVLIKIIKTNIQDDRVVFKVIEGNKNISSGVQLEFSFDAFLYFPIFEKVSNNLP